MKAYSELVVGTDFSPCSAVAVAEALRLARPVNAKVHAVHVVDTQVVIELEEALSKFQRNIRQGLVSDALRAWSQFAPSVPKLDPAAATPRPGADSLQLEVEVNNRAVGLINRAHDDRADLIVLGAYGSRKPDVGIGTVAAACVRRAGADVLLVRETCPGPYKSIVVGVDFSPTSLKAIERAARFAAMDGAALHVLHVYASPWLAVPYDAGIISVDPRFADEYRKDVETRLRDFARPALERAAALRVDFALRDFGGHRSAIVDFAASVKADLIVLGTRGKSNLRDFVLGTTAEKTLSHSTCSVLAIKPDGAPWA
jgi:universal stress protein E